MAESRDLEVVVFILSKVKEFNVQWWLMCDEWSVCGWLLLSKRLNANKEKKNKDKRGAVFVKDKVECY